jgi:phosphopantetheine--protein transferase-like protein
VLAGYTGVKPLDLQFAQSEMGKPYLLGAASTLDFNLSHSGDWLACAVTAGTRVGVDLEFCKAGREVMRLVNRFFRPEEIAALQSLDGADQRDRFYDFWTLKESAIKARGETLGPGLESRGFELTFRDSGNYEPGRIAVTTPAVEATAQYCLLSPLPAYRLAVCWLPTVYLRPRLQVFRIGESGETGQLALPLRASSWFD